MDDLTITVHAFERMEERWPELCDGLNDQEVARFIQGEVNDALIAGRRNRICPLELANVNINRWKADKNVWYLWTEDKKRGYVISDPPMKNGSDEGITVLTTLIGEERETAKKKLRWHK